VVSPSLIAVPLQELAVYRKATTVSSADEADVHGMLTDAERDSVPTNAETRIEKLKDVIPVLIEQYTAMADIMDSIYARAQGALWASSLCLS
jgi:hypothetical protein